MKKILLCVLILIIPTQTGASTESLKSILAAYQKGSVKIGVAVHAAKSGEKIFGFNDTEPLNPASTMKITTSTASLIYLGGDYVYKTKLSTDGFSRGVAQNLYVDGSGDPSIVEERLWRIAKDLRVRGLHEVQGNILINNSFFDDTRFDGQDNSSARAYNASISAFAVNFNSFAAVAHNSSGQVSVAIDPPTDYFVLKSSVKGSGNALSIARSFQNGQEHVMVSGGVTTEATKYANVSNTLLYTGTTLKWALEQLDIKVSGTIKSTTTSGRIKLFEDKSKPLALILRDLNKFSNNFTAEMVLKTLAAKKSGAPGSTEKGAQILRDFLNQLGLPSAEYDVFNGSGLSKKNRLSPNVLNQLLIYAYKKNKIRNDFIASLAIAGTDGTLKNRFKSVNLIGNVKAKTGTLNDVTSLSGYLEAASGKMVAFTIMVNGGGAGGGGYFVLQEKILNDIYQNN